jgi:hypothetical protein
LLITDRFVFVHTPKTGGWFIKRVCQEHLDCRLEDTHATYDRAPDLPIFSVVRNPWDWYVSWFHWHLESGRNGATWEELFDAGRRSFAETVRAHCDPPTRQTDLRPRS